MLLPATGESRSTIDTRNIQVGRIRQLTGKVSSFWRTRTGSSVTCLPFRYLFFPAQGTGLFGHSNSWIGLSVTPKLKVVLKLTLRERSLLTLDNSDIVWPNI
jgi:hypothetical protein